jgi:trimethylamine--corrinoid protein Co-methyltransferase
MGKSAKFTASVLSGDDQVQIHQAALTVMERVGLRVESAALFNRLRQAGLPADEMTRQVRFPRSLVADALVAAPKRWEWVGQADASLPMPAERSYFVARVLLSQMQDYGAASVRAPRLGDLIDLVRLAQRLPDADIVYKVDCPVSDVPEAWAYLLTIAAVYENTDKPCLANPIDPTATRYWIELAEAAAGEPIKRRPRVLCGMPVTSPLTVDAHTGESLLYLAQKGAPINCMTMPIAGVSAPITPAGVLAQHVAEVLGLMTIAQTLQPGLPVVFAGMPCATNMRTGAISMAAGLPLFANALTTMARYFGLPAFNSVNYTDTFVHDVQCGAEKALAALAGMLAGSDVGVFGGDLNDAMTISREQLLLDHAIWEQAGRLMRGVEVNAETLALEVIERVGPRGNALTDPHTLRWLRRDEAGMGQIFNRDGVGGQTALERAHARVEQLLAEERPSPVPPAALERIRAYVRDEQKAGGGT